MTMAWPDPEHSMVLHWLKWGTADWRLCHRRKQGRFMFCAWAATASCNYIYEECFMNWIMLRIRRRCTVAHDHSVGVGFAIPRSKSCRFAIHCFVSKCRRVCHPSLWRLDCQCPAGFPCLRQSPVGTLSMSLSLSLSLSLSFSWSSSSSSSSSSS